MPQEQSSNPLARLDQATRLLAEASTVDEVKELRDKAEVARLYARERDLGLEAQNYAAEIKIRAERKLGELLAETIRPGGDTRAEAMSDRTTLPDLGISRDQSSRWQTIATIPEPEFERHIAEAKVEERPLTTNGVLRLASDLPSPNPTRAELAYMAIGPLLRWLDTDPVEVAATCAPADIQHKVLVVGALRTWLVAVEAALSERATQPFTILEGGRRGA